MTGPGTNTYLIGQKTLFILDPGEHTKEHFTAVMRAVAFAPVVGIAPSHAHPDHWPLVAPLGESLDAVTLGSKAHNGYEPVRILADGDIVRGAQWTLKAIHTPGHTSDHVSYFLPEERALFSGDHVMGWSTSVIGRPDGDLNSYLSSLARLLTLDISVIYPAHGEPIPDARARISELIAHREMRTAQILEALRGGIELVPVIVKRIYADVDPRLHPAAQESVLAHLDALIAAKRVVLREKAQNPVNSRYGIA